MKKKLFFLAVTLGFVLMATTSCKKDDPKPTPTIVGYWKGKYGFNNDNPTQEFSMLIRSNNTLRIYVDNADTSVSSKFEGNYNFNAGVLTTVFDNDSKLSSSTVDANFTNMVGTMGNSPSVSNFGNFVVTKQ